MSKTATVFRFNWRVDSGAPYLDDADFTLLDDNNDPITSGYTINNWHSGGDYTEWQETEPHQLEYGRCTWTFSTPITISSITADFPSSPPNNEYFASYTDSEGVVRNLDSDAISYQLGAVIELGKQGASGGKKFILNWLLDGSGGNPVLTLADVILYDSSNTAIESGWITRTLTNSVTGTESKYYGEVEWVFATSPGLVHVVVDWPGVTPENFLCYEEKARVGGVYHYYIRNAATNIMAHEYSTNYVLPLAQHGGEQSTTATNLVATRRSSPPLTNTQIVDASWDGALITGDEWVIVLGDPNGYPQNTELTRTTSNSVVVTVPVWANYPVRVYPSSNSALIISVTVNALVPTLTAPNEIVSARFLKSSATTIVEVVYTPAEWMVLNPPGFYHNFRFTYSGSTESESDGNAATHLENGDWLIRLNGITFNNCTVAVSGHTDYNYGSNSPYSSEYTVELFIDNVNVQPYKGNTLDRVFSDYYSSLIEVKALHTQFYNNSVDTIYTQLYLAYSSLKNVYIDYYSCFAYDTVDLIHAQVYGEQVYSIFLEEYSCADVLSITHATLYDCILPQRVILIHTHLYSCEQDIRLLSTEYYYCLTNVSSINRQLYTAAYGVVELLHRQPYLGKLQETVVQALNVTLTLNNGQHIQILSAEVSAYEDSPYWACTIELADTRDYFLFARGVAFTLTLFSKAFEFVVDSRSFTRSMDAMGNYQESVSIAGLSPLSLLDTSNTQSITKTWDKAALASSIVQELVGVVDWSAGLVDWVLPAYRFSVTTAAPVEAAKTLLAAVGGLLESNPDGSLLARSRWPVSVPDIAAYSAEQNYNYAHLFSMSESAATEQRMNRVRILDMEVKLQDQLEWLADEQDWQQGRLRAYPAPWRDGLSLRHTRGTVITLSAQSEQTETKTEIVEFVKGEASVSHPLESITQVTWLAENLGGVTFSPYSTTLTATNRGNYYGYSLAEIVYVTRFLQAPARSSLATEAQFLLEDSNGTV